MGAQVIGGGGELLVGDDPGAGLSSIIVLGNRFAPGQVDDLLFGEPDPSGRLVVGPVGHWSYRNGQCSMSLIPNRVELRMTGGEVLPDELMEGASQIVSKLALLHENEVVAVTALGMNYDKAFPHDPGKFCTNLIRRDDALTFLGVQELVANLTFQFSEEAFHCTVRIEPDLASQGQRLFVGINAHQNVGGSEMNTALGNAGSFRNLVDRIHERLV